MSSISLNVMKCRGIVKEKPVEFYKFRDESFYTVVLWVERLSGNVDVIDVVLSDKLIDIDSLEVGMTLDIIGEVRSYNDRTNPSKVRLKLQLFAQEVKVVSEEEESSSSSYENDVHITGFICNKFSEKTIRDGRKLGYSMIAVNRQHGKSAYIPLLLWGRNCSYGRNLELGTEVDVHGRLQSREYTDRNTNEVVKVMELSVTQFKKLKGGNDNVDEE